MLYGLLVFRFTLPTLHCSAAMHLDTVATLFCCCTHAYSLTSIGDNIHTARHIARECGILDDGGIALEGPDFRSMPVQELLPLLPRLQVQPRP